MMGAAWPALEALDSYSGSSEQPLNPRAHETGPCCLSGSYILPEELTPAPLLFFFPCTLLLFFYSGRWRNVNGSAALQQNLRHTDGKNANKSRNVDLTLGNSCRRGKRRCPMCLPTRSSSDTCARRSPLGWWLPTPAGKRKQKKSKGSLNGE